MMIQIYREAPAWCPGSKLEPIKVMDKESVHAAGALHRSVHFLALSQAGKEILLRLRSPSEARYSGLFTSTAGVHVDAVEGGNDYERSLRLQVPGVPEGLSRVGEFRVSDPFENEVCGLFLYYGRLESLAGCLPGDQHLVPLAEAMELVRSARTTPHLREALREVLSIQGGRPRWKR